MPLSMPLSMAKSDNQSGFPYDSIAGEMTEEDMAIMLDVCRGEDGKVLVGKFLEEIERTGIRRSDPRLASMMRHLDHLRPHGLQSVSELRLDPALFKTVLTENVVLVSKALQNHVVVPAFDVLCDNITEIYEQCKSMKEGSRASYIPDTAPSEQMDDKWGVSICTVDGQRFSIGDAHEPFTLQLTSTPLTYAICLNELGDELVHKYQGREPSGRTFNEIVLDYNNKPHNPYVNSGGIMSAALLLYCVGPQDDDMSSKFEFVHNYMKEMAGDEHVGFSNSVFLTERMSPDRNFAIAYFMRETNCFPPNVDITRALDLYMQMCSIEMTCESSSVVAATLANDGTCPITGKRILSLEVVLNVRSLMYSCGMYNHSGQFAFTVGLPAKSGGGGSLMLVIPNVMGITLWSPNLNNVGISNRGLEFCKQLIKLYRFHRFDGVGDPIDKKMDPTFHRYETASEAIIQLLLAAASGDKRFLQRAWLQDIDMNVSDYDGRTALHLAAAEGHLECVKFLLETCQVNPDPKDRWNRTPLTEAVDFKRVRVALCLKEFIDQKRSSGTMLSNMLPTTWEEETHFDSGSDNPQSRDYKDIPSVEHTLVSCPQEMAISRSLETSEESEESRLLPGRRASHDRDKAYTFNGEIYLRARSRSPMSTLRVPSMDSKP